MELVPTVTHQKYRVNNGPIVADSERPGRLVAVRTLHVETYQSGGHSFTVTTVDGLGVKADGTVGIREVYGARVRADVEARFLAAVSA